MNYEELLKLEKDQDLPFTPDKKGNFGLTAETI